MSLINPFTASFFIFLMIVASVSGWLFRSSTASLATKFIVPSVLVALACWTPWRVKALLGFPLETAFASLPSQAELIAFVPQDDDKRVVLWLREGAADPRSYSIPLTDDLKKTLRQAQQEREQGQERIMLAKRPGAAKRNGVIGIDGGDAPYVLLPDAFSLPKKGPQE